VEWRTEWRGRGEWTHMDTLIIEALVKIKLTDPFRWAEEAAQRKRNWPDSSGNSMTGYEPHDERTRRTSESSHGTSVPKCLLQDAWKHWIGSRRPPYNLLYCCILFLSVFIKESSRWGSPSEERVCVSFPLGCNRDLPKRSSWCPELAVEEVDKTISPCSFPIAEMNEF
jgi:hypothetical protein